MNIPVALESLRVPPHSVEAEQAVLGGLLLENSAWEKIGDLIMEADFYRDDHRRIYRAIIRLLEQNKPADILTLVDALTQQGELDAVGGMAYLAAMANSTPSAANIRRYAEIVRERALMRSLVQAGTAITEGAFTPAGRSARTLLDEAEARIFQIAEQGSRGNQGFQPISTSLTETVERINELYRAGHHDPVTGVPTGFTDLDKMTAGLQPGDLVIVAGRPSMGKTALALNMAAHVALEAKLPVGIFSMEMSAGQLALRLLSLHGRIDQQGLRTGQMQTEDFSRLTRAMGELSQSPLEIDETAALNPLDLRARARRLHRQYGGLGLLVVDYLQLMSSASSGENRATEISEISRSLKALAKELRVPVMALSQLNRSLEQRPNKRPVMSDLRESGAIEQDADVILFIYRDEVYNENSPDRGTAEVIIGKQRNGPIGTVRLTFLNHYTRFENFAAGYSGGGGFH